MPKIETIRHSLAHILAYAMEEIYPDVKFGIGPAIENGFYYDFQLKEPLSLKDLPLIEKKMRELLKENIVFKRKEVSKKEAEKLFRKQPFKLELIKGLKGKISIYESGKFVDLCKGPHIKSTKQINPQAFRLVKVAGAYWKGNEKNPMLTRIYGIAFGSKKELDDYLRLREEAEKRDHRILGEKLDLFHIDEKVGAGLILWHPKGAILKRVIENYVLEEYLKNGYQLVSTPHIAKIGLWETSGHTQFYRENMFPLMHMRELAKDEKDDYQLKPMNCPFHILIYKQKIRSYREMPLRYTELGTVYRYEKSGVLHGLTRVRGFTQDDAHIWCTPGQLSSELTSVLKFAFFILKTFGFKDYEVYLSTRPKKFVGTVKGWQKATKALQFALKENKVDYKLDKGGGAFYGPKVDIKIKDSIGRAWQCTTIQVDFNLPQRFGMEYVDEKGRKRQPIMIHRALLGSLERFIGILIEHYAGAFPLWLAPEQIWILPLSSKNKNYAQKIKKALGDKGFRVRFKGEKETISKKVREGEIEKIPYLVIIGDREEKEGVLSIRQRGKGDIGKMSLTRFLDLITLEREKKK